MALTCEGAHADPMTRIRVGGGPVANPYGNFYFHTFKRKVLPSLLPAPAHILLWLRAGGLGRKNLFPFLSFPIQSPIYNLRQGEKEWEGVSSPPEPEEEDTLGQRGETPGLDSHDCCSLKSASQSAERSA